VLFFALLLVLLPFALPIVSLVSNARVRRRMTSLEEQVAQQQREIDDLTRRIRQLRTEPAARPETAPAAEPAAQPAPKPAAPPLPRAEAPPPQIPSTPPTPPTPPPARPAPRVPPAPPEAAKPAIPRPAAPRPPAGPPMPPSPPPPRRAAFDWEQLIGVKMFSAVAGIALVLAAVFFLRYSIDRGWLSPPIRVTIGILTGIVLLVVCDLKAARKYPVTANALDAAAIAILFSTFFAAHALWNLISGTVAFAMLGLVTGVAVLLSIRRDSVFIAVLGLLGGFATPILLSTGENRPIPLFAYLLLLNIGLAWVAYKKKWPLLTLLTFALTTLYQWGWVLRFLLSAREQIPLAMGIFIVFALGGFVALTLGRSSTARTDGRRLNDLVERAGLGAAVMPLFFATFLAAVPAYGVRADLLFGFLIIVDIGLLAIALGRREQVPHAVGGAATILVFAVWLALSYASAARGMVIAFASAFAILYAVAPGLARRLGRPLDDIGSRAVYAAPFLLFVFAVIARIDPAAGAPLGLFAPLLALFAIITWRAMADAEWPLYFVAAFFVVAAEAVWSGTHLTADRAWIAVAIYAAFGVFQLGVPVLARRIERPLEPAWGGGAVLIGSLCLLFFLSVGGQATAGLWGLALLLAVLNAGLFVEAAAAELPAISVVGATLSWIVLGSWWMTAAVPVGLLASLLIMVGLTLVMLAGHTWAHAKTDDIGFRHGLFLALVGHLFLFVSTQRAEWAMLPWPLFGALTVVTLAISATSVAVGTSGLHAAGAVAAAIVVFAWSQIASPPVWSIVKLAAAEATVAYALGWLALLTRRIPKTAPAVASALVLSIAELTLIVAAVPGGNLRFEGLVAAHVVNLALLLWLAWRQGWNWVAPAAVLPAWLASIAWRAGHNAVEQWRSALLLPLSMYALFTAYPFVLGRRTRGSRDPFFTAIAGSVFFFFTARAALLQGGLQGYLGIVPVVEGAVLALLLRMLLRLEPTGTRDLGRLALVAGAALAFATVAIPLQLRHQWITIGWALEGAALAWLYRRIPHRGLFFWTVALLALVFARLALNPAVFVYEPRGQRIFNWYLYTYSTCSAALMLAAYWLTRTEDRLTSWLPRASAMLPAAGGILLFLLLNIEIADYYAVGPEVTFRFGVTLGQDLTYTIGWLLFGLAVLGVCIYLHSRPGRIAAIVLIATTAFKGFLYDMGSLGGLYRVSSLVGLAVSLALVALALQKYVLRPSEGHA
jgi:uncharacterized membrane protein